MKNNLLKILLILLFTAVNIGCDQTTKAIARNTLKDHGAIQVVGNYFVLYYAENSGAFLSLGNTWFAPVRLIVLIILPIIFLLAISVYIYRSNKYNLSQIFGFCCIIGGGLSNVYDRIFHGGLVTDFMNFGIGKILRTGVLNFADLSVVIGIIILFFVQNPGKNREKIKQ